MLTSRIALALPLAALLAACVRPPIDSTGDPPDSGVVITHPLGAPDGGVDAVITTGPKCVDVTVTADELSCDQDSDCTGVTTGTVCEDTCDCGGSAVNNAGAATIAGEVLGLENGECACPAFGTPTCVAHVCTLCGFGPNPGPGCPNDCTFGGEGCDAGEPDADIVDGGVDVQFFDARAVDTGTTCVDVDLSSYATTCNSASDCVLIQTGEVCNGDCLCGGVPVSASGEAMYQATLASITPAACDCPAFAEPQCVNGQCVVCEGSNQPPECLQNGGNP